MSVLRQWRNWPHNNGHKQREYWNFFVGKFIIGLFKINECETIQDYLDIIMGLDYIPQINIPTSHARKSSSLIYHIFNKCVAGDPSVYSGIIYTNISDHLPCFVCIEIPKFNLRLPGLIQIPTADEDEALLWTHRSIECYIIIRSGFILQSKP